MLESPESVLRRQCDVTNDRCRMMSDYDVQTGGADFFWEKKGAKTFWEKNKGTKTFLKEKKGRDSFE